MRRPEAVDFVVVGAGAAGGIIAKELASAGFTVVVLEQGPRVEANQFLQHDEVATFLRSAFQNDLTKQPQTFRRTEAEEARPVRPRLGQDTHERVGYHRLVGGGSVMFAANYWRFREIDFIERSRFGLGAGTGLAHWPLTDPQLEPYPAKPMCESAL